MHRFDTNNKTALWGAYGYTPDKDAVRVPMKLDKLAYRSADVDVRGHEAERRQDCVVVGQHDGLDAVYCDQIVGSGEWVVGRGECGDHS